MEVKPGYMQTEVGVIPHEWIVCRLKDCCRKLNVSFVGTCEPFYTSENTGVLMLRTGNLQGDKIVLDDCKFVTREFHARNKKSQVRTGDILIARHGNSGNAVPVPPELDDVNALSIVILRTNDAILDNQFASYCINSGPVRSQAAGMLAGSTQVVINTREVEKLRLPLPPIPEQRAIAGALSDIDALLGALDQLIAKKRDLKQAAMQQLLTGTKRLPGFQGKWKTLNMSENSTLKARIGWQGLTTAEYLKTGEYYLVTGTDFANGRVEWSSCCFVASERYVQDRNIQLRPKDIVLTKDGTIGKVGFIDDLPGPATLNSGVFVIRPKENAYDPHFFFFVLTSRIFDDFLNKLQAGSTISHLYQKDFVTFAFLAPATLAEQFAIAEVLSDMDAELAALEQRRAKTHALKQGMMQELLTGRIRLVETPTNIIPFPKPTAPAQESKSHNWQIDEAVIIGALAKQFGSEAWPLPRKRRVKLTYLFHRYTHRSTEAYQKKAAGPYNPKSKYQGPEGIAVKNGYVREHHNGKYPGFVAGEKTAQAEQYFAQWYPGAKQWLEQFRFSKTEELELLATVDMAMEDLRKAGKAATLPQVKQLIQDAPEWTAKLSREIFSDENITKAMTTCDGLFQTN